MGRCTLLCFTIFLTLLPPCCCLSTDVCSGVDVYTAVAGAVGALYGPLHGGANEAVLRMLERIGSVENIPSFIAGGLSCYVMLM
jgi:citrate synthase